MTDPLNANLPGDLFRRMELSRQLHRLADIVVDVSGIAPPLDRTPWIEFFVASETEVNAVAHRIGQFPQQFKDQYFVDLDAVELRVRWTHTLPAKPEVSDTDPLGMAYTRADDDAVDPTPTGPREPLHTGGMTESGLVDETPAPEPCPPWCGVGGPKCMSPVHDDTAKPIDETGGYWDPTVTSVPVAGRQYFEDGRSNAECSEEELEGR